MNAIEATGLRKSFAAVAALRGLDLAVPPGGVCALLGPNGAGKTTAVRILATLTRPDAGTARVAGYDVAREARRVRVSIGLAGQHAAVDDDLTGRENLFILGLMQHLGRRAARARAAALLERFGLADAADRLVKTWSGGMRRRLDLVASLIVAPAVLFLDEPTTGLDPRSRAEIWAAVGALAADGTTVLLTTQYLDEADRLADQIVIIDEGRVTAHGSPDELKDSIGSRVDLVLADDAAAAERQLTKLRHDPTAIALTVGAPVALIVIFGYIFGSAISVPGRGNYREFLVPGLFATTGANVLPAMVAMARDSGRGVVDRFRSLPITRVAVPFGQAAATAVYGSATAPRTPSPRSPCSSRSSSPPPGSACTSGWSSAAKSRRRRRPSSSSP